MNHSTLTYVFPGQGSQKKSMGEGLFDLFPDVVSAADSELGYSIKELCLIDSADQLNKTQFTQPALFTVNALTYLKALKDTGNKPDIVIGHSLGEYNALYAAGVFDFLTGLKLVEKRGELMSLATGGGMAAIIGLTQVPVQEVINQSGFTTINIANLNAPLQTVISGSKTEISGIKENFEAAGVRLYMPLKVSGAFHSPYMLQAREEFADFVTQFTFNPPTIPVISNVEAAPYPSNRIADLLARQITSPVRWVESVQYILNLPAPTFEELGPGKVLTGLIRQIK